MSSTILNITFDCADPQLVARFWAAVTDWAVSNPWGNEYAVEPGDRLRPRLYFVGVPEAKAAKNRVHLDVIPDGRSQDDEIARLTGLGAAVVSDQRPEFGWVILADPEGNEFCVEPGTEPDLA